MKFTNKELTEKLKAQFGKDLAMSERTLTAQSERLYKRLEKSDNDDELDDIVNEYFDDFKEMNGNIRNDAAEFAKKWNKDHPTPPKPDTSAKTDEPKTGTPPNTDELLNKVLKKMEEMEAKQAAAEARVTADAKKTAIRNTLKEKGIKDDKWLDAYLKKQTFNADTDAETEVTDILNLYNLQAAGSGGGANVDNGGGGGKGESMDFSDIAKIKKKQRGETSD